MLHRYRPSLIVPLMKKRERGVAAFVCRLPLRSPVRPRHIPLPESTPGACAERWVAETELHFEHRDAFGNLVIAPSA